MDYRLTCQLISILLCLVTVLLTVTVTVTVAAADSAGSIPIALPGCKESCENSTIKIPFPFGIGTNCYYDAWYEVICNSSSSERPYLRSFGVEVLNITGCSSSNCDIPDLRLQVATPWQDICTRQKAVINDMDRSPFRMSSSGNQLVVKGCPAVAILMNRKGETVAGCSSICKGSNTTDAGFQRKNSVSACDGVECCLMSVDQKYLGVDYYQMALRNTYVDANQTCAEFALMQRFLEPNQEIAAAERLRSDDLVPTLWHWMPPALPEGSSDSNKSNSRYNSDFSCKPFCGYYDEVQCINICTCNDGFEGNPYIPNGCQGLSISLGSVTFFLCCFGLYQLTRKWIRNKKRAKFFEKNGGLLLQQQMISNAGVIESTRVFTAHELEKAADNFNINRVLGHGGQGTVYKGMLLDGRVVAIKKPKKLGKNQSDHFINEVVILSQINHRNVVKLLGCCLETEVPLLVYEFIPNGTLAKHIHNPSEDFQITWKMRLQIAAETAGALAYLHSSSASPIYHRDIKSTNILLDNKYRAKLSDFGTSRVMMIDETHLTTRVQGTFGYLDPEYFQSNQFTDKSDVYSFGVVLVELLTGIEPVSKTNSGGWKGLATEFLFHFETSSLHKILDAQVIDEAKEEDVMTLAKLAKRCLNLSGKRRPTMKEVACVIEGIRSSHAPSLYHEQNSVKGNDLIMEMSEMNDEYVSSTAYYSTQNINNSDSFGFQPYLHNSW
ncbi:Wall-associated receptor kinase-like 2 [Bienertia sinuspersici]